MSTPKRTTVYFEPELYKALRLRATALQRSVSEVVNDAVRSGLTRAGAEICATDPRKKAGSASYERLVQALKRRRLARLRARPPRA